MIVEFAVSAMVVVLGLWLGKLILDYIKVIFKVFSMYKNILVHYQIPYISFFSKNILRYTLRK